VISCTTKSEQSNEEICKADSLWIEFATALENKDSQYLIPHSFDTVQCAECDIQPNSETEYYPAATLFNNPEYIGKLMHLNSLTDIEFSTYQAEDLIRVSYKIKSNSAPEGGYNLIFTFVNTEKGYRFEGMIVT